MEKAHHAIIDPLIEPDPSDETGLNSHFRSTFAPAAPLTPPGSGGNPKGLPSVSVQKTGSSVETNPFRRSRASSDSKDAQAGQASPQSRRYGYPSPPNSASPRRARFNDNYRADAFGSLNESRPRRSSNPAPSSLNKSRPRGNSLKERFPGDKSHRPLDIIRHDEKVAHRAPHLRKKNFQGADVIDRLDRASFGRYHHEGPYDAASIARNRDTKYSPLAAVKDSNEEALRATPRENIIDSVQRHRPLEGVANIPPGMADRFGRVLNYEEGADLQREPGGDYRRWPGVEYHPNDLKGKGEPSYTIEKALKDHKRSGDSGIEMKSRHRTHSAGDVDAPGIVPTVATEASGVNRSNTTGKSVGGALKKRFGSLRRRKQETEA
ncbi:pal1 cell morphology [Pyrenophora tritici-repentis]|uniref:Pal1 cell morphology n=1 Tax=Pyrenophora tritici-repentis TaxID=45151 RepID=A0A2W1HM03_9PLEO|nr:pal1 cell morphology [Pyrenophora tritici-repentis]KAF7446204.1 pal1 cell morphology [Pyrenophora tritici-repentis]KAF7567308.1 Pal1 multi-domain protein [Pyrenophora tritici-repentis]KAG9381904.1 pal1 cell morphology [Pyrenophora tritici-repentis]KAI0571763.1 pal1 cell morphology [Pyrenophora tritici-repentis]